MKFKKIYIIIPITLVVIVIIVLIINFLNKGLVELQTAKENEIYIVDTKKPTNKKRVGLGSTQLRLSPGLNILQIQKGDKASRVTIDVKRFKSINLKIELSDSNLDEVVIKNNVSSLQANKDSLNFIDETFQSLLTYNLINRRYSDFTNAIKATRFFKVKWYGINNGLATLVGGASAFVSPQQITNFDIGKVAQSNNPNQINIIPVANYGDSIVVRIDEVIYDYNIKSKNFKEVYRLSNNDKNAIIIGALSKNREFFYSIKSGTSYVEGSQDKLNNELLMQNIDNASKKILKQESEITSLQLSPDGQRLLISSNKSLFIYDTVNQAKQTILTYPSPNTNALKWVNDKNIIYYSDEALWNFDLNTSISSKISNNKNNFFIKESVISTDGSYYYYIIPTSNSKGVVGAVYRIPIIKL